MESGLVVSSTVLLGLLLWFTDGEAETEGGTGAACHGAAPGVCGEGT